jgi:hypothetical protein
MLSIITGVAGASRKENLETVYKFIKKQEFKNYETILIEQIKCTMGDAYTEKPLYKHLPVTKYKAIENPDGRFNVAWMFNVGAKLASGNRFLFLDSDLVFGPGYLAAVHNMSAPFFFAFNKVIHYSRTASEFVRKNLELVEDKSAEAFYPGVKKHPGYSVAINKKFFWHWIGGYHENFFGWGGLDNDIARRALHIIKQEYILPKRIFHLWHPRSHAKTIPLIMNTWVTTQYHPQKVIDRLKKAKLGNPNRPTPIDISDIYKRKM